MLADRIGVPTDRGIDYVADRLTAAVRLGGEESKPPIDRNAWPRTEVGFVLRVVSGEDTGRIFPLAFMRMVVGRSTSADIQLSERSASRSHFSILWSETDRRHVVQDWGHPNRIYINDNGIERHAEHVLNVGDTVRLGDTVLRYEIRTGGV